MAGDDVKLEHPLGIAFDFSPHVVNVCRAGAGADCCRYLTGDIDGKVLRCAKTISGLAAQIEERVRTGTFVARGDNCPGRPYAEVL